MASRLGLGCVSGPVRLHLQRPKSWDRRHGSAFSDGCQHLRRVLPLNPERRALDATRAVRDPVDLRPSNRPRCSPRRACREVGLGLLQVARQSALQHQCQSLRRPALRHLHRLSKGLIASCNCSCFPIRSQQDSRCRQQLAPLPRVYPPLWAKTKCQAPIARSDGLEICWNALEVAMRTVVRLPFPLSVAMTACDPVPEDPLEIQGIPHREQSPPPPASEVSEHPDRVPFRRPNHCYPRQATPAHAVAGAVPDSVHLPTGTLSRPPQPAPVLGLARPVATRRLSSAPTDQAQRDRRCVQAHKFCGRGTHPSPPSCPSSAPPRPALPTPSANRPRDDQPYRDPSIDYQQLVIARHVPRWLRDLKRWLPQDEPRPQYKPPRTACRPGPWPWIWAAPGRLSHAMRGGTLSIAHPLRGAVTPEVYLHTQPYFTARRQRAKTCSVAGAWPARREPRGETASTPAAHQQAAHGAGTLTIGRCPLNLEESWHCVRDR